MSVAFGDAALRAAGHAARLLGWRPAEFWTATPAELAAALAGFAAPEGASGAMDDETLKALMERDPDGR